MITFCPGPSKVYPQVCAYMLTAYNSGILSQNHRSIFFEELLAETTKNLKEKLAIPKDYHLCFVSSATECWEIVNQSLLLGESHFYYNGAFGEKWAGYAEKLKSGIRHIPFSPQENIENSLQRDAQSIALVQNETSNGTAISSSSLGTLQAENPNALLFIDATSSMGGIALDWQKGDVWFASIQKCFGLPAGMAIMVYSDKAVNRAKEVKHEAHYNNLLNLHENSQKNQTAYTPNTLAIFLLNKLMKELPQIGVISENLQLRAEKFYTFVEKSINLDFFVTNKTVRSTTVFCIKAPAEKVKKIHQIALQQDIILGDGYGSLKETTFRIANFPAIENGEYKKLRELLQTHI